LVRWGEVHPEKAPNTMLLYPGFENLMEAWMANLKLMMPGTPIFKLNEVHSYE